MKTVPFLLASALAFICVILSFVSFFGGQTSNSLQSDLLKKQGEIQELSQKFSKQQADYQLQMQSINTAKTVVERAQPVLQAAGYLVAKNKNEKLKTLLVRQKLEVYIPTDEQLKQAEEAQKKQAQAAGGATPAPAPGPALRAAPTAPPP